MLLEGFQSDWFDYWSSFPLAAVVVVPFVHNRRGTRPLVCLSGAAPQANRRRSSVLIIEYEVVFRQENMQNKAPILLIITPCWEQSIFVFHCERTQYLLLSMTQFTHQ